MDLFTYLLGKNKKNTQKDLFSYLLGKNAGGSGTYTTFSGITLNIASTLRAKIKNFMLNSTELTQDGTPTPSNPVDVNVITGDNNIKVGNGNLLSLPTNATVLGITSTQNSDGSFTLNGTVTSAPNYKEFPLDIPVTLEAGTYYLTIINNKLSSNNNININLYTGNSNVFDRDFTTIGEHKITVTLTETKIIKSFRTYITTGASYDNVNIKLMISKTSDSTFVEHQEQNYPITLDDLEYCKIGDYADQISNEFESKNLFDYHWFGSDKEVQWTYYGQPDFRAIPIYIGIGNSATFSSNVPQTSPILLYAINSLNVSASSAVNGFSISNSLTIQADANGYVYLCFVNTRQYYTDVANGTYYIQIEIGSTATEFMPYGITKGEWYLKKNIGKIDSYNGETIATPYISTTGGLDTEATIYYGLTTPTYIHISQEEYPTLKSELDNLYNNAKSYNGQTNITQTNDDLPFNISVDVKVLDTNLNVSNSLNSSLLSNNLQNEEETSLGNTNEIDEIEEPIENEEVS